MSFFHAMWVMFLRRGGSEAGGGSGQDTKLILH